VNKSAAFHAGAREAMTKLAFHDMLVKEAAEAAADDQALVWFSENGAFLVDEQGQFWQLDMDKEASLKGLWSAGKTGIARMANTVKRTTYNAAPALTEASQAAHRASVYGPGHAAGAGAAKLLERGAHAVKGKTKSRLVHGMAGLADVAGAMAH